MNKDNRLAIRSPLIPYFSYPEKVDANIYLKAENLQPFGSFKLRGIEHWFNTQDETIYKHGIAAASVTAKATASTKAK